MAKKIDVLKDMFSYCRPMGSATEAAFVAKYVASLPNAEQDEHGNWHVTVGDVPVLWSCHTDTVHYDEGYQLVSVKRSGILGLARGERVSNCLGADDTAGVYLMREMVLAKVPGHYVFHYGEENGCVGSRALAQYNKTFLKLFKFAIAFDRQGTSEVITHQSYGRTCSDKFAWSLAAQLGGYYKPSDRGIYTDTNEYAGIIPECTNVSVGYYHAHSPAEILDTQHLFRLLAKLKKINWKELVCDRDPKDDDDDLLGRAWGGWNASKYIGGEGKKAKADKNGNVFDDGRDVISADYVRRYEGFPDNDKDLLLDDDEQPIGDEYFDDLREDPDYKYLDPIFGEVQRELRSTLKQRQSGDREIVLRWAASKAEKIN
jgi:hypothetical protein